MWSSNGSIAVATLMVEGTCEHEMVLMFTPFMTVGEN